MNNEDERITISFVKDHQRHLTLLVEAARLLRARPSITIRGT
jgi:hypothetical protein